MSENNGCNLFRKKPGNTSKVARNSYQLFVGNSLVTENFSTEERAMRDRKSDMIVIKVCRGMVFVGGGILFCLLLIGLGILYGGISVAFWLTDSLIRRLERCCR